MRTTADVIMEGAVDEGIIVTRVAEIDAVLLAGMMSVEA